MVLSIVEALAFTYFPTQYTVHIVIGIATILALRVFSQGRRTTRERDLHNRTVLLTGGFTPLGMALIESLALRGAHIIALSPDPVESTNIATLIHLLRSTTNNEQIYADECDLTSPTSIRAFCTKFLTEKEQRLDAIIFAHEHKHIGSPNVFSKSAVDQDQKARDSSSLATFLITTLLLPALLVAPPERDIRIINVVNPFYAAAAGTPFSPSFISPSKAKPSTSNSIFFEEGRRSLRTVVFTRHLQRILDALPTAAQVPKTEESSTSIPIVNPKVQKSNIVAITASPGIGRVDTVSNFFNADLFSPTGSILGLFLYLSLQPILRIFTKSPALAIQSILHVLFLPTPFKILSASVNSSAKAKHVAPQDLLDTSLPEEVLLPGSLYANCASVKINVNIPEEVIESDRKARVEANKVKGNAEGKLSEEVLEIADDGAYGGELAGRLVWEEYEGALKIWEQQNPGDVDKEKAKYAPNSPTDRHKTSTTTEDTEFSNVY